MKFWKITILFLIIALLSWGLVSLEKSKREFELQKELLEQKLSSFEIENRKLKDDIEYLHNPDNLVKILKGQTNFVAPGEHLIIPVTGASNTQGVSSSTAGGNEN